MSAKKQTSGKTTKKSNSGRKSTSARAATKSRSNPQPKQPLLSSRVRAILFGLAAALFFGLIFVRGAIGWMTIRSFFFGLLGICIFLVPIVLIYLCIMTEKEKQVAHIKAKIFMCVLLVMLVSAFTYVATGADFKSDNYDSRRRSYRRYPWLSACSVLRQWSSVIYLYLLDFSFNFYFSGYLNS